jgi:hypothetical protein
VVGAFILVTMETYLAQTGSWVTIIEGVIFVVCVLTFREGIVGVVAPYIVGRSIAGIAEEKAPPPDQAATPRKEPERVGGAV